MKARDVANALGWLTGAFVTLVFVLAVIASPVIAAYLLMEYATCRQLGTVVGRDWEWHALSGCYVARRDGQLAPLQQWRLVE